MNWIWKKKSVWKLLLCCVIGSRGPENVSKKKKKTQQHYLSQKINLNDIEKKKYDYNAVPQVTIAKFSPSIIAISMSLHFTHYTFLSTCFCGKSQTCFSQMILQLPVDLLFQQHFLILGSHCVSACKEEKHDGNWKRHYLLLTDRNPERTRLVCLLTFPRHLELCRGGVLPKKARQIKSWHYTKYPW